MLAEEKGNEKVAVSMGEADQISLSCTQTQRIFFLLELVCTGMLDKYIHLYCIHTSPRLERERQLVLANTSAG